MDKKEKSIKRHLDKAIGIVDTICIVWGLMVAKTTASQKP